MLRADCTRFTIGKPLVSVDALRELRDLLSALQASANCGKASLKIMPKEGIDETAEAKHTATATTATATGSASSGSAGAQTKGLGKRTGGTSPASRGRKRRQPVGKAAKR
jgi:hypothetical protein